MSELMEADANVGDAIRRGATPCHLAAFSRAAPPAARRPGRSPRAPLAPSPLCSLLWFKRRLPRYATKFIEMCVVLCADHGPCVSGECVWG